MLSSCELTRFIKQQAESMGFEACGIASAEYLADESLHLDEWLKNGFHAGMDYMERNMEKRLDPRLLMEGAKSVIVFIYNYYPEQFMDAGSEYLVSSYAYGSDYHDVIREKLNILADSVRNLKPGCMIRGFVDSAPVLERAWACRAGLGWIGKNSMIISRKKGSFFFISELITDLELDYDDPFGGNYCGDCSRCIDACPTAAIVSPRVVDAGKCISYLTIENKGGIPETSDYRQWIFGCDICQQVCPWNKYATPHSEPAFQPIKEIFSMQAGNWEHLDQDQFRNLFRKSPVKRAKFDGLKRNIRFLSERSDSKEK